MTFSLKLSKCRLATIALALTILFSSCLPYLFLGPLPIWMGWGLICTGIAILNRRFLTTVGAQTAIRWVIGSWGSLILITVMLDVVGYMLNYNERDLMSGPFLSLLTLFAFMGTLATASFANRSTTVFVIFAVAMVQGTVSILQFIGVDWAWAFSDAVISNLSFLSRVEAQDVANMPSSAFGDVGRVRGTHIFVHIFNGIQSTLVAFCIFMSFHSERGDQKKVWQLLLRPLVVTIATTGLLLSFSRSGVVAVLASLLLALLVKPKAKTIIGSVAVTAIIAATLSTIEFTDAVQFARLLSTDVNDATTQVRIDHLGYVFGNFNTNPLIGTSGIPGVDNLDIPIHSVPMRYLNDYGIVGFVLYFSVFVPFAVIFVQALGSRLPGMGAWAGAGLCVLVAIAADSWTHSSGFLRRDIFHAVILGLIVGSIIGIRRSAAMIAPGSLPHSHALRRSHFALKVNRP